MQDSKLKAGPRAIQNLCNFIKQKISSPHTAGGLVVPSNITKNTRLGILLNLTKIPKFKFPKKYSRLSNEISKNFEIRNQFLKNPEMTRDRTGPPSMTIKCSDGASNNPMSPYATEYSARIGIGQKAQVIFLNFRLKTLNGL